MAESYAFRLTVSQVGPVNDPAYQLAPESVKAALLKAIVVFGLEAKDKALAAGLDRFGKPMKALAKATIEDRRSDMGPATHDAPPLEPALGLSRTRSLLDGRALTKEGVAEFFWRFDEITGGPWGKILGYHREGSAKLPVRDVIGMSKESIAEVRTKVMAWWRAYQRSHPGLPEKDRLQAAWTDVKRPGYGPKPPPPIPVGPKGPRPIPVIGRTDLQNATFGEGSMSRTAASLAAGQHSGFYQPGPKQLGPAAVAKGWKPPPAPPPPAPVLQPKPKPEPKPKPVPPPAPKPVQLPLMFVQSERERDAGRKPVVISIEALDAAWEAEGLGYYIPPGGGEEKQKYKNAMAFLLRAADEKIPVEMPRVAVGEDGSVGFTDGRHRFAAMRDMAQEKMPVSIAKGFVAFVKRLFGWKRKP